MEFLSELPVWLLGGAIFLLRIGDVSLGTVRTLAIVEGRITSSMVLGFFEVLIWIVAVSQVVARLDESAVLPLFYAGGFAAGNGVGIVLERRLALGTAVLRIISQTTGERVATVLRDAGQAVTTFAGAGRNGSVTLLYVTCPRSRLAANLALATREDPSLFYVVERAHATGYGRRAVADRAGRREFGKEE
ncbi:MAG: DUF5698 domain-containing protein [Planctomycetota bacterium]